MSNVWCIHQKYPNFCFQNFLPATNNAAVVKLAAYVSCSDLESFRNFLVYLEKVSETKFGKLQKLCFGNKVSATFWCIQDFTHRKKKYGKPYVH